LKFTNVAADTKKSRIGGDTLGLVDWFVKTDKINMSQSGPSSPGKNTLLQNNQYLNVPQIAIVV
jgi:hypothetical protein